MSRHCPSCGGLIGRDCFNPAECAAITQAMQSDIDEQHGYEQGLEDGRREAANEIEQLRKALDHEHECRVEAAVEGSRYKARLLVERQNVRLLHDATIILRRAILTGDPTGRKYAYREATALIDKVADATRQIEAREKDDD